LLVYRSCGNNGGEPVHPLFDSPRPNLEELYIHFDYESEQLVNALDIIHCSELKILKMKCLFAYIYIYSNLVPFIYWLYIY
jgi:hypothetical protein